jgi:hypothetical protein
MSPQFQSRENPVNSTRKVIDDAGLSLLQHKRALYALVTQHPVSEKQRKQLMSGIGIEVLAKSEIMRVPNFQATTASDILRMAELYDRYFFAGHCLALARFHGIRFRWSKRMTSAGGKTVRMVQINRHDKTRSLRYEIVLSSTLLFQTFSDLNRPVRVTGLICANRLEAMQRILEHELIHLVEMLIWDESCCAASRFQTIANQLFGHTAHKHDLITQQERASEKFNVRVGSRVKFRSEGKLYSGIVNRITRRATVLVEDPSGQRYDNGHCYLKFYVPLSHLEKDL